MQQCNCVICELQSVFMPPQSGGRRWSRARQRFRPPPTPPPLLTSSPPHATVGKFELRSAAFPAQLILSCFSSKGQPVTPPSFSSLPEEAVSLRPETLKQKRITCIETLRAHTHTLHTCTHPRRKLVHRAMRLAASEVSAQVKSKL